MDGLGMLISSGDIGWIKRKIVRKGKT